MAMNELYRSFKNVVSKLVSCSYQGLREFWFGGFEGPEDKEHWDSVHNYVGEDQIDRKPGAGYLPRPPPRTNYLH